MGGIRVNREMERRNLPESIRADGGSLKVTGKYKDGDVEERRQPRHHQ